MKKILFILIFCLFLFGLWQGCQAVDLLIPKYPEVPGAKGPGETTDLPEIINYIYRFALLACGVVAFVSILIGAVRYIFSAGNATIAGDAKDQITQALLGVLILLASVLILRTINPDLVNLNISLPSTPYENSEICQSGNGTVCYCKLTTGEDHCYPQAYGSASECASRCINYCKAYAGDKYLSNNCR